MKPPKQGSPNIDTTGHAPRTVTGANSSGKPPGRNIESFINRGKPVPQPAAGKSIESSLNREMAKRRNNGN